MKISSLKHFKGLFLAAILAVNCLCMAATGFTEAKAIDFDTLLRAGYAHTERNEFFIRNANMYYSPYSANSWGEVIAREESGRDGSVTRSWLIGDIIRDENNNFVLNVKRHVIQKADGQGKIYMSKVDDVDYDVFIYIQDEGSFRLFWNGAGMGPCTDIVGTYVSSAEYPLMSSEAAMYVLARYMNSIPAYRDKLQGAAMQHIGDALGEIHTIKLLEHHPTHVVTRGIYQITAAGSITEYDAVTDKWYELVH